MPRAALFLGLGFASLVALAGIPATATDMAATLDAIGRDSGLSSQECHEPRGPIHIAIPSDFNTANGVRRGTGTSIDPYIIDCWIIDKLASFPIYLGATSQYTVLRDVEVLGNGAGSCLFINGTANVLVERFRPMACPGEMIRIESAAQITIMNSTIVADGFTKHPLLISDSGNVRILRNTITGGDLPSIGLCGNLGTEIAWNNISMGEDVAVSACGGSGELVHHNRFMSDSKNWTPQARDGGNNRWDDGAQGNWWSDLTGPDEDRNGIVDVPYPTGPAGQRDRFPLCPVDGCWWSGGMRVSISANRTQGPAPLDIAFASNVSGGSPPYLFAWDFGDGGGASVGSPDHRFVRPGAHLVELTVEDSSGGQVIAGPLIITASESAPPRILATSPLEGARDVPVDSRIQVEFSSEMDPFSTEAAISLAPSHPLGFLWSPDHRNLSIDPFGDLGTNTTYLLAVDASAMSVGGLALGAIFNLNFTTALTPPPEAPAILLTSPAEGDIGVPLNADISFTFSVPMDPATTEAAVASSPSAGGKFSWSQDSRILRLDPAADLAKESRYEVRIGRQASSAAGARLADEFILSFTTGQSPDLTPPSVTHVPPPGIAEDRAVFIVFDISDSAGVESAVFYYRSPEGAYSSVEMVLLARDDYVALLPGSAVKQPRMEYYAEARDRLGNVGSGPAAGAADPYQVPVIPTEPGPDRPEGPIPARDLATFVAVGASALVSAVVWRKEEKKRDGRKAATPVRTEVSRKPARAEAVGVTKPRRK